MTARELLDDICVCLGCNEDALESAILVTLSSIRMYFDSRKTQMPVVNDCHKFNSRAKSMRQNSPNLHQELTLLRNMKSIGHLVITRAKPVLEVNFKKGYLEI